MPTTTTYTNCTPCCGGGTVEIPCCAGTPLPLCLLVTVTDITGECVGTMPSSFTICYDTVAGYYTTVTPITFCPGVESGVTFQCDGTTTDDILTNVFTNNLPDAGGSCNPLLITYTGRTLVLAGCDPNCTMTFTVTEAP